MVGHSDVESKLEFETPISIVKGLWRKYTSKYIRCIINFKYISITNMPANRIIKLLLLLKYAAFINQLEMENLPKKYISTI